MDAIDKIRSVMEVLRQRGGKEKQLWLRLRDAVRELAGDVRQAHESEIEDIKRRAGIVEFGHPPPGWEPNKTPRMSSQLYAIARAAQGGGRLDQHQIETIWRAHELLKSMDK